MCQAICRYAKANNKYMNNYDKNKESSYLEYLDANNLYRWAMCKKLPVGNFKWLDNEDISKFNDELLKKYDENSDIGYIFEVDVEYPKHIRMLHKNLPFLPEKRKINKSTKLICNVQDKKNYVVHIVALKQALNRRLKLAKIHKIIQFDQEAWLKSYIDLNTRLRKDAKNIFQNYFFKLMINAHSGKTMQNKRKHRDFKLVTSDKTRSILVSEPNYHTSKHTSEDLMIIEMKKVWVKMNIPIYLGQVILDISKTLIYEFWYDYIKSKYGDKARALYMDTDSFVINIKT